MPSAADWNDPQADALWRYDLHYLDDLCAEGAEARHTWHEAGWAAEVEPCRDRCGG